MKKGRRGAQTSHSNSRHFVAPDVYSASAIHLPFPRASRHHPDEMTEETVRSHHVAKYFRPVASGSGKILEGPESPLGGKLAALNPRC
jgi:hypothetical protein